jgi:hypothetical protein
MITKVWYLSDEVTRHDLETLYRAGVNISIITDDYPIDTTIFHTQNFVKSRQEVQITTTGDEEEAWLKLCFGERLMHFSTRYNM